MFLSRRLTRLNADGGQLSLWLNTKNAIIYSALTGWLKFSLTSASYY
jgi:hypothetical protein